MSKESNVNIRQQIVENLKTNKNATIASVSNETKIDRAVVRYHVKALAKAKFVKLGRGTSGPNGSAPVELLDVKKAAVAAATWTGRSGPRLTARSAARRRARVDSLGGGKRRKNPNGIGTSPKPAEEVYLVTSDKRVQNEVVLGVSIHTDKEGAIIAAAAADGAQIFAGRRLSLVRTLEG